jgi:hypothetical protein
MTIYAEEYIGECAAGSCDRPAAVVIFEDFMLCALHDHRYAIGQEIDAASISLDLAKRWRSEARMHEGTQYLVRLFDRAEEDLTERLAQLGRYVEEIAQIDHENVGTHDLRTAAREQSEDEGAEDAANAGEEGEPLEWVQVLKDAVVQLDTAAGDRLEEGRPEIARRIEEVMSAIEDELERLTGEEIPRPIRRAPGEDEEDAPVSSGQRSSPLGVCSVGSATDTPCLRPAVY